MRALSAPAVAALHAAGDVLLLDVREAWEYALCHVPQSLHIPMNEVPARMAEIARQGTVVVLCHHGMRSLQVARYLAAQGYPDVVNLDGGIDAWARDVDPSLATY